MKKFLDRLAKIIVFGTIALFVFGFVTAFFAFSITYPQTIPITIGGLIIVVIFIWAFLRWAKS